jgi:hypothetical protein
MQCYTDTVTLHSRCCWGLTCRRLRLCRRRGLRGRGLEQFRQQLIGLQVGEALFVVLVEVLHRQGHALLQGTLVGGQGGGRLGGPPRRQVCIGEASMHPELWSYHNNTPRSCGF